jgi:hypothetical protein
MPSGWKTQTSNRCGGGVCVLEDCEFCGTDIQVGENIDSYYCTATGFKTSCENDLDCADQSECTVDKCLIGSPDADSFGCVRELRGCGEECDGGICDGEGVCISRKQLGESCLCEVCATGLYCNVETTTGVCAIQSSCGNGDCDQGECLTCPDDCSLGTCSGNNVCDTLVGENCLNSPDCKCKSGRCDPLSEGAEENGCVVSACGDGICLPTECTSCSLDCQPKNCLNSKCDIDIGENCENSKDCICDIEIELESDEIEIEPNVKNIMTFTIKNTGNSRQQYTIYLGDGSVYTSWRKVTVDLSPGQESLQQVEIWSMDVGSHTLDMNITSGSIEFEKSVDIEVPAPGAVETTFEVVTVIAHVMSLWEFLLILIGLGATVKYLYWRFKSPDIVVPHDEPGLNSHFHNRFKFPHPNYQQYYKQHQPKQLQRMGQGRAQVGYPNLSQNQ